MAFFMWFFGVVLCICASIFDVVATVPAVSIVNTTQIFVPERDGFFLFRIPALAKVNSTHIFAFAEGRGKRSVEIVCKVCGLQGDKGSAKFVIHRL